MSPNEEVQILLGKVLAQYQEERKLKVGKEVSSHQPTREEATNLMGALKTHVGRM
jgi:hypothetical protein